MQGRRIRLHLLLPPVAGLLAIGCSFPHAIRAPEITKNLVYKDDGTTGAFDRKVKSVFAIGSEESTVRDELASEGFTISQTTADNSEETKTFKAIAESIEGTCDTSWTIVWTSREAKITDIKGEAQFGCE